MLVKTRGWLGGEVSAPRVRPRAPALNRPPPSASHVARRGLTCGCQAARQTYAFPATAQTWAWRWSSNHLRRA